LDAQRTLAGARIHIHGHGDRARFDPARTIPQSPLCEREHRAAVWRTDPLVVTYVAFHLEAESEVAFGSDEVMDFHLGSERVIAPPAVRGRLIHADLFVEPDGELSGPLENVEEFAEGQIEQREDDRYGMQNREER